MARTYATPAQFKQALDAHLRARAEQAGLDLERLRQRYVFDRFCPSGGRGSRLGDLALAAQRPARPAAATPARRHRAREE
jgi:hypothetical protein